ncbi:hypothetical protein G0U57_007883, partial [Chelydra serpentina]
LLGSAASAPPHGVACADRPLSPQGAEVQGTKFVLQLKHPDHATPAPGRAGPGNAPRPVGREPVRVPPTLECHFWRNAGCSYGPDCRFRHLPQSKGLDKKLAQP